MTSRRSFFKRLARIIAVVALAPEIAFGRKLETVSAPELDLNELLENCYAIMRARQWQDDSIYILTDSIGAAVWESEFPKAVMKHMESNSNTVGIYEQLRQCRTK